MGESKVLLCFLNRQCPFLFALRGCRGIYLKICQGNYSVGSESDTRANLIDPVLHEAGWKGMAFLHREYIFTDGRKLVGNKGQHAPRVC